MKKTMTPNHSRPILSLLLLLLTCAPLTCAQNTYQSPPPPVPPYNFNPSMLVIIFVLISAFFFTGFFSIYIRQCSGESTTGHGSRRNGARGRSRRGLDPSVIETFPIFEYSVVKGLKLGKGTLECAVCLSEFEDDETLRLLPKCSHVFHPDCIDAWLESHTTCPVCRADLVPGSGAEAAPSITPDPVAVAAEESDSPPDHVAIAIDPSPSEGRAQPDVINPSQMAFQIQNRPMRLKSSQRPARFPRSHSTGHSLVSPGENVDRFTLRLPENVRKEIISGHLKRTTSLVAFPTEVGSSHGGRRYRGTGGGGEGSSRGRTAFQFGRFDRATRSDRWVFSMTPPFVSRTGSVRLQKRADGEMSGSSKGGSSKGIIGSAKTPFDCLVSKNGEPSERAGGSTPVFTISSHS